MMGKVSVLAVCIASLLCLPLLAQDALDLEGALALYQDDHIALEFSEAGKLQLEELIDVLRAELGVTDDLNEGNEDRVMEFAVAPESKHLASKLSQAYYTLANLYLDEPEDEQVYIKGKHWGMKSLRMNPEFSRIESEQGFVEAVEQENDVAALYWTNSNWLRQAQKHPLMAVTVWNIPPKVKAIMERCLEIAPDYIAGGPYRQAGGYYAGLPIGQDLDLALTYFCHINVEPVCDTCEELDVSQRVAGADLYLENRTFIAEFYYMETEMWAEAKAVLESVLAEEVTDVYPLMNAYAQENARQLLATVEEKL